MKIEFLTQDDPRYILPFFDEFVRTYGSEFEIAQVACCRAMGKRSRWQLMKELASLYGVLGVTRLAASVAISKALGKVSRRKNARRYHSIAQLCSAYGIPFVSIGDPNSAGYVDGLRQRGAEVLVSVACPYILKNALLSTPPLGCVNIHHAPLPRYKGMMPTFWQMFHGERSVGVSVHYMAQKIDEGALLLQENLAIEPGESLDRLIRRSIRHGAHCMAKVLRDLAAGAAKPIPPMNEEGSYFTFPNFEQIREFKRRGLRAI